MQQQPNDPLKHFRGDGPWFRLAAFGLQTLQAIAACFAPAVVSLVVLWSLILFGEPARCAIGQLSGPRTAKAFCPSSEVVAQGDTRATPPAPAQTAPK